MEHKFSFKKLLSVLLVCAMLLSSFTFLAFAEEEAINVALGKEYTAPEALGGYNAKLTDGVKDTAMAYDGDKWFAFKDHPTQHQGNLGGQRTGEIVIDLGGSFELTEVKVYAILNDGAGVSLCSDAKVYLSDDGATWGEAFTLDVPAIEAAQAYTIEGEVEGTASFVKVELTLGEKTFLFFNEIEVFGFGEAEEDDGPYNYGLNIDLSDNEQLLISDDEAIKLLTDGDWALDAEGWGGKHDGVVLVQNKNASDADAYGMANFIWKFEDTPDPYNTIKFGLYSDVNSMIGFPTEEDVFFSNDGLNWVSGYSSAEIGYGETIPDAFTKFDGEATVPGTVVAEIKLRSPQTYKYVKIEFYYPKSPFTEENGYTNGTAKPRWEFFGLTEVFDFSYVDPSSVITDFNAANYWESRYGRGGASFGYTDADAYAVAYDNFISSAYTQVAFAPVAGVENVYEVVAKASGADAFEFPEGGFIWAAYTSANAGSAGKAAIDLFATMSVGEAYEFTGIDFENGFGAKDAAISKYVDPNAPKNVLLGVAFDKLTGTYYSYGSAMATDGSELTDGYHITEDNYVAPIYKVEQVAGFGGLSGGTLELEGALDATYSINKIAVYYANGSAGSGICEPGTIKAFYKNGDGEWIQFGETFESTETDENQNDNSFVISSVEFTVDTAVNATDIRFEMSPRTGKTMVFISELEAWGTEATEAPEVPDGIVIDGALTDWEDNWTVVNGETGYWQAIPTDEAELAGYYNFQITSDENNLYIAAEIVDLTCTAFRVWFRTNPEATVYTHFYHIDANGAAGKVNTSTTANSATAITDSKAVGVFKVGEDSIIVEISIPLSEIGATDGNVEYYANTQSGSTLFYPPVAEGENGDRLANLPYKNWYVAPSEPEVPELPDVVEIKVSHVNAYNWGTFESMIITGDGKTVEEVIGQKPIWWIVYTVENVDGKYVATSYLKNSEDCYKVTVPTGGFLFYVFDANSAYAAADEEKLLGYTFVVDGLKLDGVTAIDTTKDPAKVIKAYAPGVEIPEPEPAPITSQVVAGFNLGTFKDHVKDSAGAYIFTDAEVYAGTTAYSWWRHVAFAPVADMEGTYEVIAITNGEGGTSGGLELPEGGFIWVAFEWAPAGDSGAYALALMNSIVVGDYVTFTGIDLVNCTTTEDATAIKYVDPDAPVNIALGKDYTISGCGTPYAQYQASLTDGAARPTISYDAEWFTFYCNGSDTSVINAPDHIGYVIIDLGAVYDVDTIKANVIDLKGASGIKGPKSVKAYLSTDNATWSEAIELDLSAFVDANTAFAAVATVEGQAQYVKVEFELDGPFAFVNEIEVYGEEYIPEPAYKDGLTIEIDDTLVGWIGDAADLETIENGLTDGNWGAGDAGDWTNASGIYPFMNKVCKDGSVHPEINLIYNFGEATKVNTIELGVYSSYNVMIGYPSSLIYVYTSEDGVEWSEGTEAYLDLDIPAIGNEGSVSTTLTLAETINAQFVKVVLSFPDSPFEDKVVWEFVGLTEIAFDYIPVTSNVVTDFNPNSYKESIGGATGAFIYDDADIYAACGNDWWIHVAFAPVADKDGYYEVVAVRAPTTGNYLAMPENGFIWMAWSSAGDSPETAGAYALAFMSNLKVGDIVEFVGVDFANHTTEADAYAEVWIDPDAPVNVALGKDYELSGPVDSNYSANLTDGNAYAGMSYDSKWFVFNQPNSPDGIGYAIIDLGGLYDISKVAVNLINETVSGVAKPEYVKFYVSEDGATWTDLGEVALQDIQSSAYWTGIEDLTVTAQFVKLEVKIGAPFSFLNEIEVYGKKVDAPVEPIDIELVEGDNEITVPAGGSAIANTNFDKDLVITIKGQWGITVLVNGVEYYPNRMGVLEAPLSAGENEVEFKNGGEEDATFAANLAAPTVGDTPDDPIIIDELGDFTAEITDKYPQGVYYTFTATEDGTLVITIKTESGWTYVVNNLTAGKYGDTRWSDDEEVIYTEIIEVKAGDEIQIVVNTYDPENMWGLTVGSVDFSVAYDNGGEDTVEIALGDVNMDGVIDQYDYVLVKRAYFGTYTLSDAQFKLADANGDGKIDPYDYLLVARHYFETFVIEGTVEIPVDALPEK